MLWNKIQNHLGEYLIRRANESDVNYEIQKYLNMLV